MDACFKSFFKQTLQHTTPSALIFYILRTTINIRALQAQLLSLIRHDPEAGQDL
jgi:hypothetical protein